MKPLSLFYSYSHRDEAFREELEAHLAYLRRGKLIAEWHDRMIGAGDEWKQQIDHSLASADIVLLLVSADFIASDYCWGEEMTKALARHERGEARVIPVILRPCRWERTPLGRLQAVPKNARPVSEWPNRDAAFEDIASAIERTVEEWGEERLRAAGQAQREADEARQRAEAEAARLGEQQRRQAEEEHQRLEAQARREAEQARQRAELDAKRKAELGHKRSEAQSGPEKSERVKRPAVPEVPVPWGRFAVIGLAVAVGLALFWLAVTREPKKVPARPAAEPPVSDKAIEKPPISYKPGTSFWDCHQCPEMVVIPAGDFVMGSPQSDTDRRDNEGPQRKVNIPGPLAVGKYEVTFEQWDACVAAGGCEHRPDEKGWGRGKRPVINVSWHDARAYAAWLARTTGKAYRLLSEAEWEYAARAGTTTRYPWGDELGSNRANCNTGSQWSGRQTAPVGSFQPNAFGLYDMIGNVSEWTQDCWNENYRGAPVDGRPWETGDCGRRVERGGSLLNFPEVCRSAFRFREKPGVAYLDRGFRLARTL